jgi:hypothetical protein
MKKAMLSLAIGAALLAPLSVRGEVTADTPGKGAPGPHAGFQASREATGTVIETMDSGGYTYVQVDTGAQSIWAAAPRFEVSVGDRVTVPPGAPMANFYSKTLDRSFEMIYFVGGVVLEDTAGAAPQPAHPEIAAPGAGTTSKDGRSDLTATTQTEVSVGAIVTVRGTLGTDKDFGFNYQYDVIVEDASVTED